MAHPRKSEFVDLMLRLSPEARLRFLDTLPHSVHRRLKYTWELWARPEQLWRPGPETWTVYLGGRGGGKSATGIEAVRYVAKHPELCGGFIGIAGRTANEVNRTMVAGLMARTPPREQPRWWKNDKLLAWKNGVEARLFSGEEPKSFRGPNIGFLWPDELAHWSYLKESWAAATNMLRVGDHVRGVVTTTPLGVETIERLVWQFTKDRTEPVVAPEGTPPERMFQGFMLKKGVRVVNFSTYANAGNLAENFLEEIVGESAGTAAYEQEIEGRILRGVPTALWKHEWIRRIERMPDDVVQVVVGVDPSGGTDSRTSKNAEVGIVVAALGASGLYYVIEDCSGRYTPEQWGARVWRAFDEWGADGIAVESNYGGDMALATLRMTRPNKNAERFIHRVDATRNKAARAGRVTPLYSLGRVVHCGKEIDAEHTVSSATRFAVLERQLTSWDPTKPLDAQGSPDRMDALVWALIWLNNGGSDSRRVKAMGSKEVWDEVRAQLLRRAG